MGDEAGRGRLVPRSHGPLGNHQWQVPLQCLLGRPGCVVTVPVGFPGSEQEDLARQVFILEPFFACTDP